MYKMFQRAFQVIAQRNHNSERGKGKIMGAVLSFNILYFMKEYFWVFAFENFVIYLCFHDLIPFLMSFLQCYQVLPYFCTFNPEHNTRVLHFVMKATKRRAFIIYFIPSLLL